ncbi:hypothetical protein HanXRQr2_Chr03g0127891 [Helianthus annuus]|uniref:Uncharacterized protein n=1 Tax=Helianthus annuus TaxID=4232 RepID=A0A9K3JJ09_HELAN|nr:hypothetical protein HanXRQr2_Chr03g0127891 [Helianthus annuus]KAJ0945143.1 hypothetical protein HanPSC8_Chr03g0124741 [Helianthus annuus]
MEVILVAGRYDCTFVLTHCWALAGSAILERYSFPRLTVNSTPVFANAFRTFGSAS